MRVGARIVREVGRIRRRRHLRWRSGWVEKVDEVVHVPVPLLEVPVPVPEVLLFEVLYMYLRYS